MFVCNGKNFCTYFLRLTKENAVSDLGCPVVSRLTCFEIYRRPSAFSAPF